eukprot:56422_1
MSTRIRKRKDKKRKQKHRRKSSKNKSRKSKSVNQEEINSTKEFLKALDRIAESGDYRINVCTSLPLLQIKYKHFIEYIDGWFTKYNKSDRISIINEQRERQSQRIDLCETQSINLIMSHDAYLRQKQNWNIKLQLHTSECHSNYRPMVSCMTLFIKNLPNTFISIYPSPLELKAYSLTFLPSESALKNLVCKLTQIPSWHLLERESNTFQQITYFLDCNNKNLTLKSLLYSPIMSPTSSSLHSDTEMPTIDLNGFGIPPDEYCSFSSSNPKKRKRRTLSNTEHAKKRKLHKKATYYKEKYIQMTAIAKNLYNEVVDGESPRWHLVNFVKSKYDVIRDAELEKLRQSTISTYGQTGYDVEGMNKWKGNKTMQKCIQTFLTLNDEYCKTDCVKISNGKDSENANICDVIERYKIVDHSRIKELNGQYGIRAKCDIDKHVCLGQYIGAEVSREAFAKVFDDTGHEHHHNVYAFDQQIDESKWFVIDPQIGEFKDKLLFRFVNDCRADIAVSEPTKEDKKHFNVEFVAMKVNGWPQTYLITRTKIKQGAELMTFYGSDFHNAITLKTQNEQFKIARKQRVDHSILKGFKL